MPSRLCTLKATAALSLARSPESTRLSPSLSHSLFVLLAWVLNDQAEKSQAYLFGKLSFRQASEAGTPTFIPSMRFLIANVTLEGHLFVVCLPGPEIFGLGTASKRRRCDACLWELVLLQVACLSISIEAHGTVLSSQGTCIPCLTQPGRPAGGEELGYMPRPAPF